MEGKESELGASYKLVPMNRSHLKEVAEIERTCFTTPWSEEMLEEQLYNPDAAFIVAEGEDGTVLGYAGLQCVLDEGYLDTLAVRESCRRLGVGSALVDTVVRFGREHLAFLSLEVRKSNEAAIHLYEKYGFEQVGVRPGYYELPREDALLLTIDFERERGGEPAGSGE